MIRNFSHLPMNDILLCVTKLNGIHPFTRSSFVMHLVLYDFCQLSLNKQQHALTLPSYNLLNNIFTQSNTAILVFTLQFSFSLAKNVYGERWTTEIRTTEAAYDIKLVYTKYESYIDCSWEPNEFYTTWVYGAWCWILSRKFPYRSMFPNQIVIRSLDHKSS